MLELKSMNYLTHSPKETKDIAKKWARKYLKKQINQATIICLFGDLGSGKTVFVQGLADYLLIKNKVNSPTFVINRRYPLINNTFSNLYHFDFYRLDNIDNLEWLNWSKIIKLDQNIIIIEWPNKIYNFLPLIRFNLNFSVIDDQIREISYE